MNRTRMLPLTVGLAVALALLAGCHLPAAPDVTPTLSQQQMIEEGMAQLGIEAAEYSATLTEMAQSPQPTPTLGPISQATPTPTTQPTAAPTPPPTSAPTQPPEATVIPTAVSGETTYVAQPGDNLFRIALRFGLRVEDLAAYNNIVNPHHIYVGQVIRIPAGGMPPLTPMPSQGETLYTVQPGDNLFRIALRYNLNYLYLASYNGIANPHRIYVGQVIRIPVAP